MNSHQHVRNLTRRGMLLLVALLVILLSMPGLGATPAFALPNDPSDPDPIGGADPRTLPDNGFEWSVPRRFGNLVNGMFDYHWTPDNFNPYVPGHYAPGYVHPANFRVNFDGCGTDAEESTGTSALTYTWTFEGQTTSGNACQVYHDFPAQGSYTVMLKITDGNGNVLLDSAGRGNPFTQTVVVRDILIVSLGDSYGSGEGSPDVAQVLGGSDLFFQPTHVEQPARWEDTRCHRSANAPAAQAARQIEAADLHTSVTFLSFACSGATINREYYADQSNFDPYRSPSASGWTKFQGSGILAPYSGAVPPNPDRPQDNMIPSQIDQLVSAITSGGSPRHIDALLISGGGNDIGFGNIAGLCTLYYDCKNYNVTNSNVSGPTPLSTRIQEDLGAMPGRYTALANALSNSGLDIGGVYVTQYPDSTRNDQGGFCDKMLDDVIPVWMQPLLALASIFDGGPYPPLPPYQIGGDEVVWAGSTVLPGLNGQVAQAAAAHGWTLVDGIADGTANLFSGHGYCASDNWIRTASEAVDMQGPWVPWNVTLIPPASTLTKGTLHPTTRGYQAVAERIVAKVAPVVLPPASSTPQPAPSFSGATNGSINSANGWLTGAAAGQTCPAGATGCAFAQEVSSVASSTAIRGASLLINGAHADCTAAGVTVNGVLCTGQLVNPQSYNWSFTFPADGIYRLDFSVSARNGTVGTFTREVKVDLHNPTAGADISAPAPASGWYRSPVTLTLTGRDGSGSGVQNVQYQVDGSASTTAGGNTIQLPINNDGVHTLTYHVVDFAGRSSATQLLTVNVDQTKPQSSAALSPAPNSAGWNKDNLLVTLSSTDNGGSGIQNLTYSATGAQTIASTTVNGDTPTPLTFSTEGVISLTFGATDVAGNVEAIQSVRIQLDKSAPVITIITPTNAAVYTLNQAVPVGFNCVDGRSGVATCIGTAPNGSNFDTSVPGSKTFTVNASDKAGNASGQSVVYNVAYNICALFDQSKSYKLGSTVPIKLQLCDAKGANVSSSAEMVNSVSLTQKDSSASSDVVDSGNANPDNNFRFDATLNGYIYNLSTKGLSTGTWRLSFTVAGDPTSHAVQFDLK